MTTGVDDVNDFVDVDDDRVDNVNDFVDVDDDRVDNVIRSPV
jgi:hypothetical protein